MADKKKKGDIPKPKEDLKIGKGAPKFKEILTKFINVPPVKKHPDKDK